MQFIFVFLDRSSKLIVISRRLVSENYIMLPIYIYILYRYIFEYYCSINKLNSYSFIII